jgi:hypothetical protein
LALCCYFTREMNLGFLSRSQILVQIQQTAVQSQRGLNATRQQLTAKERERRIVQLTAEEIGQLDSNVNLYKGVGKMCSDFMSLSASIYAHETHIQVHDGSPTSHGQGAQSAGERAYGGS